MPRFVIPQQLRPAAGRHLPRDEAEPSGEVAGAPEGATVADRRHEGGGAQHADAGDRQQALGSRVGAGKVGELRIQGGDAAVELAPFGAHVRDQLEDARAQPIGPLRDQRVDLALENTPPLRVGDPTLEQDRTQLVEQGSFWPPPRVERARCSVCRSS